MTARDFEALAVASAPDVIRARCLVPSRPGAQIEVVVVVARTGERCPALTFERRDALESYFRDRAWGALDGTSLRVRGPEYRRLVLDVELLATDPARTAAVEHTAHDRLMDLLDPVSGGRDGTGWPFGRRLAASDIFRVLANIDGLDRVAHVTIGAAVADESADNVTPTTIVCCAEPSDVRVTAAVARGGR